jgi:hypothetical protein
MKGEMPAGIARVCEDGRMSFDARRKRETKKTHSVIPRHRLSSRSDTHVDETTLDLESDVGNGLKGRSALTVDRLETRDVGEAVGEERQHAGERSGREGTHPASREARRPLLAPPSSIKTVPLWMSWTAPPLTSTP